MKIVLLSVVAAIWLVTTDDQVRLWRGPEMRIWLNAVQAAPLKPRPWNNLARQYALHGHLSLADDAFLTAIQLSATRPVTERDTATQVASINRGRLSLDFNEWLTRLD